MKFYLFIIITLSLFFVSAIQARPAYAVKEKLNCITCHVSPWGAGARRTFGKIYGARKLSESKHLEEDWYYLDFRAVFSSSKTPAPSSQASNSPENTNKVQGHGNNKRGLMTSQVFAKYQFLEDYSMAINYDFGTFKSKLRETYFLIEQDSYTILIGQFYLPFGLLTDEHRTYTKMLTATGLRDYEKGAVLTKRFNEHIFTDFGIFKGYSSLNQKKSNYGVILNTRFFYDSLPLLTGVSYLKHKGQDISPEAFSIYGIYNFKKYLNATLSFDFVIANHFNDIEVNSRYIPQIIPSNLLGTYAVDIKNKVANAAQVEFRYNLKTKLTLIYKFDYLVLDQRNKENYFSRNGIGFQYQPLHNVLILAKYEVNTLKLPAYLKSDIYTVTESSGPVVMIRAWY